MHDYPENDTLYEQLPIPLGKSGSAQKQLETDVPGSSAKSESGSLDSRSREAGGADLESLPEPPCDSGSDSAKGLSNADDLIAELALPESESGESNELLNYSKLLEEKDSGGIEILVQMAQKGELDPKNIDIIDATDRFLRAIAAAPKENLRRSGKIIFHASVLLRLKAEALLITKIEDLDLGGDDFIDFDTEGSPIIYDSNDEAVGRQITLADLQRALVRRSRQRQSKQRRVTLEQLIESLREAERLEKKRLEKHEREPKAVIQMDGYQDMQDMDDILELAHDEDIEDVIARIEQLLVKVMEEMIRTSLSELIAMLDGRGDWVDAFLAVLFLSNAGKINLEQEVFYGPLYLLKGCHESELQATGTDGAAPAEPHLALSEPAGLSKKEPKQEKTQAKRKRVANTRSRKVKKPAESDLAIDLEGEHALVNLKEES